MKKITLRLLQNAEHFALMTDVEKLLKEADIPQLAEIHTAIVRLVEQEDAAQKQIRKSEHTDKLTLLDEKRDKIYRGLVLRVQSEQLAPTDAIVAAADKLMIIINTYGNFTAHNYQKETAEIYNLIQDFRKEEYADAVKAAGVKDWVQALETANEEFRALFENRRDEYAAQPMYDLKNIRKELDAKFQELQKMVQALQILNPTDALQTLATKLDASVQKWKDTVAQRSGARTSKQNPEPLVP